MKGKSDRMAAVIRNRKLYKVLKLYWKNKISSDNSTVLILKRIWTARETEWKR